MKAKNCSLVSSRVDLIWEEVENKKPNNLSKSRNWRDL